MQLKKFFFLFLIVSAAFCKGQQFNFRNFTQDNGLPQSYIYAMKQTRFGYMAIGTGDGLSFFGGNKFKTFTSKDGLAENFVTSLENDAQGTLWIGHFQNGLSYFKDNKFSILPGYKPEWGAVNKLFFSDNKLWVGTRGEELVTVTNNSFNAVSLPGSGGVFCFARLGNFLYAGTAKGIRLVSGKNPNKEITAWLSELKITALAAYKDSMLIAGEENGAVFFLMPKNNTGELEVSRLIHITKENPVKDILVRKNGTVLVGLFGEGIKELDVDHMQTGNNNGIRLISEQNGLKNSYVQCLYEDFEESSWIGTYGGGILLQDHRNFYSFTKTDGLKDEQVLSVIEHDNVLYSGTEQGLQWLLLDGSGNSGIFNETNGFVKDPVKCLEHGFDGRILVGTKHYGLYFFDPASKKFSNANKELGINSYNINHIAKISKNHRPDLSRFVISSVDGIYFYDLSARQSHSLTTLEGLPHNNVYCTWSDKKGKTWFAAHNSPLALIQNDSITLFKDIPGFRSYSINSICGDNDNNLFFGTEGDGFFKYDANGVFRRKTADEGLLSNYIYGVIWDRWHNAVICTHKNGISIIRLSDGKIKTYGSTETFSGFENNLNAFYSSPTGKIYFGTARGIGVFDSEGEKINTTPPIFHILQISANKKQFTEKDTLIELPYGEYTLRLDYLGISFRNSNEVKYFYKIDGLHNEYKVTDERTIEFPRLHDGTYVFRIYAENSDGVRSPDEKIIRLVVDKPIYKKPWFLVLAALALAFAFYGFLKFRIKQLEKKNRILEEKVREKTKEIEEDKKIIEEINKDLEYKNVEITSSIDYAKRIQMALLPKKQVIQKNLDSFIFYRPRDIVSGDFYWFAETEHYFYFAVVDCTGHGVPGAFMSLIGSTYLDQIILDKKEPQPADILTELDFMVIEALKQKSSEGKLKDGMDMGLVRIEKATKKIMFSGADRPLVLVSDGVMTECKSPMFSIGGHMEGVQKKFSNVDVTAKPGDWIYLFSDGFSDQFGGEHFKRYSTKRLKNLFIFLSAHNSQDQYELLKKELKEWKGEHSQMDDILIAGIKI
jgi:serine phosphatase RsbU (regulator of sigma subunit)/ligand-binding sensor domain-containing protein